MIAPRTFRPGFNVAVINIIKGRAAHDKRA